MLGTYLGIALSALGFYLALLFVEVPTWPVHIFLGLAGFFGGMAIREWVAIAAGEVRSKIKIAALADAPIKETFAVAQVGDVYLHRAKCVLTRRGREIENARADVKYYAPDGTKIAEIAAPWLPPTREFHEAYKAGEHFPTLPIANLMQGRDHVFVLAFQRRGTSGFLILSAEGAERGSWQAMKSLDHSKVTAKIRVTGKGLVPSQATFQLDAGTGETLPMYPQRSKRRFHPW